MGNESNYYYVVHSRISDVVHIHRITVIYSSRQSAKEHIWQEHRHFWYNYSAGFWLPLKSERWLLVAIFTFVNVTYQPTVSLENDDAISCPKIFLYTKVRIMLWILWDQEIFTRISFLLFLICYMFWYLAIKLGTSNFLWPFMKVLLFCIRVWKPASTLPCLMAERFSLSMDWGRSCCTGHSVLKMRHVKEAQKLDQRHWKKQRKEY